jgi:hypothetical protein
VNPILEKYKKPLIISYILFLVFGGFYVRSVLNSDRIEIVPKPPTPKTDKVEPIRVTLNIESYNNRISYAIRMKNVDSVTNLLDEAKKEHGVSYEVTMHTYGSEFDHIMGITPPVNYSWRLFEGEEDITNIINGYRLTRNSIYTLKLLPTEALLVP